MLTINFKNVEDAIFFNKEVQQVLPEFKEIYHNWSIGMAIPSLRHLRQKAISDLFNIINDEHIAKLESFFKTKVTMLKNDTTLVKSKVFDLNSEIIDSDLHKNLFIWRDANKLYVSSWR